jgi:hypothetical protein
MRRSRLALVVTCLVWMAGTVALGCDDGDESDADADADVDGDADADADSDGGDGGGDLSVQFSTSSASLGGGETFLGSPRGPVYLLAEVRAGAGDEVALTASIEPAVPVEVSPALLLGGGLVEVFARPTAEQVGGPLSVTIRAEGGDQVSTDTVEGEVIDLGGDDHAYADSLLADFLAYFAESRPEMGIGSETDWIESFDPRLVLVVTHRLYLSEGWELHLAWHNTIAPYDWAWVTARPRDEFEPTIAVCFPSQSGDRTVQETDSLSDPRVPCAAE